MKKSLLDLVDSSRTDKNTTHSYLHLYEILMCSKRDKATDILEIGIQSGGSIKLWRDYFVNANIHGIDIIHIDGIWECIKENPRIKLYTSTNAYDSVFIDTLSSTKFDVVIDDGPHTLESMMIFVSKYLHLLKSDGILIVEDVQQYEWIEKLKGCVPENLKGCVKVYDLRHVKGRYDDIVFVVDKS